MLDDEFSSHALIGRPQDALDTPALIVDLDVMEANMAHVLAICRSNGVAWRPHCKGHKSPDIARLEIAAGAIGITCAKLGEAEVMAAAGIGNLLIANQIVGPAKTKRLIALSRIADVTVAVDSVANVEALHQAAMRSDARLNVAIEVNVGMNRAGVEPGAPVLALAHEIAARSGLRLRGLLAWESHAVRIADAQEKKRAVDAALTKLTASASTCADAGHAIEIVSCGGTGTLPYCAEHRGVTEIQAGGVIFSDMHYRTNYHVDLPPALTILATVTSRPTPTRIVSDAGRKAMSSDMAMPAPIGIEDLKSLTLSAEHAKIELAEPSAKPAVGSKIEFIVGYSDSTVFLHDEIVAVRKGAIEAIWPVLARGKLK